MRRTPKTSSIAAVILTRLQARRNSMSVKVRSLSPIHIADYLLRWRSVAQLQVYKAGEYVMKSYSLFLKLPTVTPRAVTFHTIESPFWRFYSFAKNTGSV